jgi:hypothetical protein
MPETEFFATDNEIVDVVNCLLAERCELIPDIHYSVPLARPLTEAQSVQRLTPSTPHFFAVRGDLLKSPLAFREVRKHGKHFFYIDPRKGGPTLQFWWGKQVDDGERLRLGASWLAYYSWYEDSITGERKKVSRGLSKVYSNCNLAVRATRRMVKPGKRAFWIGPSVEQLVRRGAILVGLEDFSQEQILG